MARVPSTCEPDFVVEEQSRESPIALQVGSGCWQFVNNSVTLGRCAENVLRHAIECLALIASCRIQIIPWCCTPSFAISGQANYTCLNCGPQWELALVFECSTTWAQLGTVTQLVCEVASTVV